MRSPASCRRAEQIGVPMYTLLGDAAPDEARARAAAEQAGVVGVVVLRPVRIDKELSSTPASFSGPMYGGLWGGYYGLGWGAPWSVHGGELRTDTIIIVETLVYSLAQNELVWGGQSKTKSPANLDRLIADTAKQVAGASSCGKASLRKRSTADRTSLRSSRYPDPTRRRLLMNKLCLLSLALLLAATARAAEDFDGSRPLDCKPLQTHDCLPTEKICTPLKPEAGKDETMHVDVANMSVQTPFRNTALPIASFAFNAESLVMQGTSIEVVWSATIHRTNGKLIIAIADREGANIIFGQCALAGNCP